MTTTVFSQQTKKEYFYDEEWRRITKVEFIQRDKHEILISRTIENDTAVIGKLFMRYESGTLNKEDIKVLRQYLENISKDKVDTTNVIVINYYSGAEWKKQNGKTRASTSTKEYLNIINKMPNVKQYWFYNNDNRLKYYFDTNLEWLHDKDGLLERSFFPIPFLFGGFAVIHPCGSYTVCHGEHHKNEVFKTIEEIKE